MTFGQPNAAADGELVTPLNFRFFISDVVLLGAGAPTPADLVTAAGEDEPYGIHLFNAEDSASVSLRLRAPAGTYSGMSFVLGLDEVCDGGTPSTRTAPLDDASQMTWPHTVGYLFLRFEARVEPSAAADGGTAADGGAAAIPSTIHMGGLPGVLRAPTLTVAASISIDIHNDVSRRLLMNMDAIFAGASMDADTTALPAFLISPEVVAGERLRQHAPALPIFSFAP